jgi:hypothetical protein
MTLRSLYLWLWLCISVSLSFSSQAVDCSTDTTGLCTPTIEEIIDEVITETTEHGSDGITITTTTETTTTTTTVTNEDSGNILDGDNGFVISSKEGDMDIDWGGQGSASMPSGSYCNNLGTDKCAEITGSGNSTSVMGVPNMGTTFINTIDISELNIKYGGETNYSIHVDKQDPQDSVYMHITGKDGTTEVFSGTDILSASGTASGFKVYENTFEFSGSLTTLIVEVGGRDIGISVGVLFDDVQINVLYNTINTIITQAITSVEMFIALNADASQEIINVVEDVFESNMPIETDVGMTFEPIEIQEPTYEEVEIEIAEIEIAEIEIELEIETEIEATEETTTEEVAVEEDITEPEQQQEEAQEEEEETSNEIEVAKNEEKEPEQIEEQEEKKEETQEEKKEESSKEKAVKKIMKKMDDKKKYDDVNQTKTLVVMQVLGNTKTFFQDQQQLNDRVGFFSNVVLPDTIINDNDMASYFLFVGSDGLMNEMIDSQWQQK